MRDKIWCSAAAFLVGVTMSGVVHGQVLELPIDIDREQLLAQQELPSPEELIERHIEATGGREAYEKLRTRRLTGTLQVGDQGAANKIVIMSRPMHDRHVELYGSGGGVQRYVTNSDESWTYQGNVVVASGGEQRVGEILRAAYDALLDWPQFFPLSRTMGVEPVDGRDAYRVRLLTDDCHELFLYFDKETGRNVRRVEDVAYAGRVIRSDAVYSDYREFDGIEMPTRNRRQLDYPGGRQVQYYVTEKVEHNVELEDELFETPPELRGENADAE
jgi:hypothetical protein